MIGFTSLNPFTHPAGRRALRHVGLGLSALALLALPTLEAAAQGPPSSATVRFGNANAGSPFPPSANHDQSGNARDNLIPRTVVIAAGPTASVTFEHEGRHHLAIYAPGTTPAEINTTAFPAAAGCPPIGRVNDDDANSDRLFETSGCPPSGTAVTTPPGLFTTPGRYLVICQLRPHFVDFNMYGWVNAQ